MRNYTYKIVRSVTGKVETVIDLFHMDLLLGQDNFGPGTILGLKQTVICTGSSPMGVQTCRPGGLCFQKMSVGTLLATSRP